MKQKPQNNFSSYLLVLASLFIIVFITKNLFNNTQILLDERSSNEATESQKRSELDTLKELQSRLWEEWSEALREIQWFNGSFSEEDIIEYLHKYAGTVNAGNDRIVMRDVSISGDKVSDIGFSVADITVTAVFSSENTLFSFLDYLTNPESTYRFYISSLSYPLGDTTWNLQVSIPLTLYYK